ncbi:MAG: heavy-metal-associated domain-containing protein [Gammaproteobacteria bacterium]
MKKLFLLSIFTLITWAENPHDHMHHSHEGHLHEQLVDGKKLEVDPIRFDNFVMGLENSQIAIVNVKGMVCDFCARGIEKTFKKDTNVKKIDVDLSKGKVLIAYNNNKKIKFDEIKEKILINGQNAIDMAILNL